MPQEQTETKKAYLSLDQREPMSYLMMDNEYDASYDAGVAVKEESPEAVVESKKKKNHRGRSNTGMPRLRSGSTSSTDDEAVKITTDGESTDNAGRRTDDHDSAPATVGSSSGAGKKSKKKRRREMSSNSNTDDGTSNEGISTSSIHAAFADGVERKQKKAVLPPPLPLKGMFVNERTNLPVYQHSAEIVDLISNNDVVLVVAETVRKTVYYPFMHRLYFFCRSPVIEC